MLKLGIMGQCNSSYASPVVNVKKPDGSQKFCCDFRKLTSVTVFDADPVWNPSCLQRQSTKQICYKNRSIKRLLADEVKSEFSVVESVCYIRKVAFI